MIAMLSEVNAFQLYKCQCGLVKKMNRNINKKQHTHTHQQQQQQQQNYK